MHRRLAESPGRCKLYGRPCKVEHDPPEGSLADTKQEQNSLEAGEQDNVSSSTGHVTGCNRIAELGAAVCLRNSHSVVCAVATGPYVLVLLDERGDVCLLLVGVYCATGSALSMPTKVAMASTARLWSPETR